MITLTKEEAYKKIASLVERFEEQKDFYKQSSYNETLTRRDFLDPFFKALGWDIDNEQGYAESYREVIHEDKVKVSGATKAPDYSFRLPGGKRLFFVEAKKPSILVKDDTTPAYQVRRYGWSAKLAISIITDFEEFAIYDCTKKPLPTDRASNARIKYLTYTDYLNEFDFIWDTFSKERVLKGSFDKYISSDRQKRGTSTVDNAFLESLDNWRTYLANNIALRNNITEDELNFAVQQIIDRIIFLRIAEDRNVEVYGKLKETLNSTNNYNQLLLLFLDADQKYNSGLFDFNKDKVSGNIYIDNKIIKSIINDLYYPICPYEFSVLSVEILGSAYEQFLGKQITLNNRGKAVIEVKPDVRKAGGVYYTPQYIVDYIVEKTVGMLLVNKTPKDIVNLRILDPACGSGSFLLGAYQYLLTWHKDYYTKNGKPSKGSKDNPLTPEGNLTTNEKKRILLNNIFGVDLDSNAVEVTKLSLLLKCMEGETEASISSQLKLFHDRILPTLDNNIKTGNSLIDIDFYSTQIDFGEERKIKPFSWQRTFPQVFKNEGFDCIIGNPPYVMLQSLELREVFNYALQKFESAKYKIDTYQLFMEQSIKLLRKGGLLGFITPNTFLKNIHAEPLRRHLLTNTSLTEIVLFNYSVFADASVDTCVFILSKEKPNQSTHLSVIKSDSPNSFKCTLQLNQSRFSESERFDFNLSASDDDEAILSKIKANSSPLASYCGAYFGIQTYDRTKYVSTVKQNDNYQPVIDGGNIEPYYLKKPIEFVDFQDSSIKSGGNPDVYKQDRLCIRQIGAYPITTFVPAGIYTLNTVYNVFIKQNITSSLLFILGVINSRAARYYWLKTNSDEKKTFPKIKKEAILSIPIPNVTKADRQGEQEIIKHVELILKLKAELSKTKLELTREQLTNRINFSEVSIDQLVYKLFNLTEDDISIIER